MAETCGVCLSDLWCPVPAALCAGDGAGAGAACPGPVAAGRRSDPDPGHGRQRRHLLLPHHQPVRPAGAAAARPTDR